MFRGRTKPRVTSRMKNAMKTRLIKSNISQPARVKEWLLVNKYRFLDRYDAYVLGSIHVTMPSPNLPSVSVRKMKTQKIVDYSVEFPPDVPSSCTIAFIRTLQDATGKTAEKTHVTKRGTSAESQPT